MAVHIRYRLAGQWYCTLEDSERHSHPVVTSDRTEEEFQSAVTTYQSSPCARAVVRARGGPNDYPQRPLAETRRHARAGDRIRQPFATGASQGGGRGEGLC